MNLPILCVALYLVLLFTLCVALYLFALSLYRYNTLI